jgi:hypothetical protein
MNKTLAIWLARHLIPRLNASPRGRCFQIYVDLEGRVWGANQGAPWPVAGTVMDPTWTLLEEITVQVAKN